MLVAFTASTASLAASGHCKPQTHTRMDVHVISGHGAQVIEVASLRTGHRQHGRPTEVTSRLHLGINSAETWPGLHCLVLS